MNHDALENRYLYRGGDAATSKWSGVPATCPIGGATAASHGHSRTDHRGPRRSQYQQVAGRPRHRVPKLIVRVRFSSPAPPVPAQVKAGVHACNLIASWLLLIFRAISASLAHRGERTCRTVVVLAPLGLDMRIDRARDRLGRRHAPGVLANQRRALPVMAHPRHQVPQTSPRWTRRSGFRCVEDHGNAGPPHLSTLPRRPRSTCA